LLLLLLLLQLHQLLLLLLLQVYVHYNELLNFLRAAVSLLALPSDAGPSAVMAALAKLVEQAARWGQHWFLQDTLEHSWLNAQHLAFLKQMPSLLLTRRALRTDRGCW
jgi:hypothetical protein